MSAEPVLSRRIVLFAVPVLMVPSGCSSLIPSPPVPQIYRLSPQIEDPQGPPIPNSKLIVDLPTASQSLDTDRMALMQGRIRLDYYADSVWTDRLPALLQSLMVEAFEADGRVADVGRDIYRLTKGYLLRTEIRRFEAQYEGTANSAPEVVVVLALQLTASPEGRSVGNTLISVRTHAAQDKVDAVVMAFDNATGDALAQSVAWTVRAISGDRGHGHRP
jgi:cholesterol transport system auxiliary component